MEKSRNKREWVKTVAIIFLSVLLVLTFFSNSIMNYSLPKVATEYIQNDTITAKIRGTGVVETSDPYELKAKESRQIKSVKVQKGDVVEKGQILMELEDKDSEELRTAKEELDKLKEAYITAAVSAEVENLSGTVEKVESDKVAELKTMAAQLTQAKGQVEKAQNAVDAAQQKSDLLATKLNAASGGGSSLSEQNAVSEAQKQYDMAKSYADLVKIELDEATNEQKARQTDYEQTQAIEKTYTDAVAAEEAARLAVEEKNRAYEAAIKAKEEAEAVYGVNSEEAKAMEIAVGNAQRALEEAKAVRKTAIEALNRATTAYNEKNIAGLKSSLDTATYNVEAATQKYNEALTNLAHHEVNLNNCKNNLGYATEGLTAKKNAADLELTNAKAVLENATKAYQELQKQLTTELSLDSQYDEIRKATQKVEKLEKEANGSTIEAPIAGTISEFSYVAGESTTPDATIAKIIPSGKDKTVSFSVTNEQARRVNVGCQAEIVNGWYFNDVTVKLIKIKNDPDSKGSKKILTFAVSGEVEDGQSMNLSVGDKSSTYDFVVPNVAIREDKDGKFILTIKTKSSPLGNRYIAQKVPVEVLASDETKTAIKAEVQSYDYVITTASKPVEPGNQVRLND